MKLNTQPEKTESKLSYAIVNEYDVDIFADEVQDSLASGFKLYGDPFFANGKYHQAVVKVLD